MNRRNLRSSPSVLLAAVVIIVVHLGLSLRFPSNGSITCIGIMLSYAVALGLCVRRSTHVGGPLRAKWRLVSFSFALSILAFLLLLYRQYHLQLPQIGVGIQDFVAFLRGIPLLLAVSLPDSKQERVAFRWIASLQACLLAGLSYFAILVAHPLASSLYRPLTDLLTEHLFVVEYLLLAAAFSLRLLARYSGEQALFYRSVCLYLWVMTALNFFVNQVVDQRWNPSDASAFYVLCDIAILGFATHLTRARPPAAPPRNLAVASSIDHASPVLVPLTIFALGSTVARSHFAVGLSAIGISLLLFAIRTTLLQMQYRRIQQQLLEENELNRSEALIDQLTRIPNRRSFDRTLDREWRRAERTRHPIGLLMIDIDAFKNLNDTLGHPEGDRYLVTIASILDAQLRRATDFLARYGGEEFAVILTDATEQELRRTAESLRQAVADARLPNPTEIGPNVSISIGGCSLKPTGSLTAADLLATADRALYQAKRAGRNRVHYVDLLQTVALPV